MLLLHFVLYRGQVNAQIVLCDCALVNVLLSRDRFHFFQHVCYVVTVDYQLLNSEPHSAELNGIALDNSEIVNLLAGVHFILDDAPDSVGLVFEGVVV